MAAGSNLACSPASGGRGERRRHGTQRKKEKRGLLPENTGHHQPPLTLPAPQVRSPPAALQASSGDASRTASPRLGSRDWGASGGSLAPHVARALSAFLLFSRAPQTPQLPCFHRPQLAPPPRFSAMQLQGSLFPRLRIPTLSHSERRRAGGGGGRRRRGRRRLRQVSVRAATRSPHVSRASRHRGAEAKVRPGWGGEAIRSRSRASALQATVAAGP